MHKVQILTNIDNVFIPLKSKVNPFQVYILHNTQQPEWMQTRKMGFCLIWYFGCCFGKQEIDMFVAIQCRLWLQYVYRTLTFPLSDNNKCTALHHVADLLEEMTSFLASVIYVIQVITDDFTQSRFCFKFSKKL